MTRTFLISLLAALALAAPAAASPGDDAGDLLDWIADHPRKAGLAVYARRPAAAALGRPPVRARLDAQGADPRRLRPRRPAAGRLDPAERVRVDAVERWYFPRTDGGAHPNAVADWTARGVLADGTVPLDEVAWAMIRWSDNAAADYLLERVGARAARRFGERHGMRRQDPLGISFGEYLAWTATSPARWARRSPGARAAAATAIARATPAPDAAGRRLPSIARQRRFAASSTAGTPREWARLMRDLDAGNGPVAGRARDRPAPPRVAARRLPRARLAAGAAGGEGRLAPRRADRRALRAGARRRARGGDAVLQRPPAADRGGAGGERRAAGAAARPRDSSPRRARRPARRWRARSGRAGRPASARAPRRR